MARTTSAIAHAIAISLPFVCIINRIPDPIHIQISALHDSSDLRRIGVCFQAQLILALVDLLRIIAVDAVGRRPVGILLGKTADIGIVIPRTEVIGLRLAVKVLAAVAERIRIQRVRILLYAERIVIIGPCARSGAVRQPGVFRAGGQDLSFLLSRQLFRRHRDVQPLDLQAPFFHLGHEFRPVNAIGIELRYRRTEFLLLIRPFRRELDIKSAAAKRIVKK